MRVLQDCVAELQKNKADGAYTRQRLEEMLDFLSTTSLLFEELIHLPTATLKGTARLRGKLKMLFTAKKSS